MRTAGKSSPKCCGGLEKPRKLSVAALKSDRVAALKSDRAPLFCFANLQVYGYLQNRPGYGSVHMHETTTQHLFKTQEMADASVPRNLAHELRHPVR